MVPIEFVRTVSQRVCLEIDTYPLSCDARIDADRQVLDRSGCQHVELADDISEEDLSVIHHDVDHRTEAG